jgi:hypothetical protein
MMKGWKFAMGHDRAQNLAVVDERLFIETVSEQRPAGGLADQGAHQQRRHERKLVRHLENDQNGSQRRPDHGAQAGAHRNDRYEHVIVEGQVQTGCPRRAGKRDTTHRAQKKIGRKDAAATARAVAADRRDELAGH